jgi:hypothetical protein
MAKYKKKPVVIEAIQLTIENVINDSVADFLGDEFTGYINENEGEVGKEHEVVNDASTYINTLEGRMKASMNDWIIKGVSGEFYPCKPHIFEKTYELVTE